MRTWFALAVGALMLAGCGESSEPVVEPTAAAPPALDAPANLPLQVADFPALASKDCAEVVGFYLEALGNRRFDQAALAWDDPVIDAARLEALFAAYEQPRIAAGEPQVEGAAGSLYCTIEGALTDAADPSRAPAEGTLVLRRANDVPGATPDQLRWTIRSSTFVEPMERSGTGEST